MVGTRACVVLKRSANALLADHVIFIPRAPEMLLPILEVMPLQLLAHHIALRRLGCRPAKKIWPNQ
jgi:glucosamine 6-phosphate synthetase-like amidotransferase/phosphosugar isomerase protein